ncbi:MAG: hypothetical protein ChlgKO_08560 [Chlamydiales bacterium]
MTFDYLNYWIWSGSTKVTDLNDSMSYYDTEPDTGPEPTAIGIVVKSALEAVAKTEEAADRVIEVATEKVDELIIDSMIDDFVVIEPEAKSSLKGRLISVATKVQKFALDFLSDVLALGFGKWMKAEDNGSWFAFVFGTKK